MLIIKHDSLHFYICNIMERFHSRDQQRCWITETKESICLKIELNSRRVSLIHHHGRYFYVLENQHGRHDVM